MNNFEPEEKNTLTDLGLEDEDSDFDFKSSFMSADRLTDWKKEPTIEELKSDYDMAKPSHDAFMLKVKEWNDLRNIEGKHKLKKQDNRSSIQPKLVRRQAEWRYSALTEPFHTSKKVFTVSPETFEDVNASKQNELLLNNQFRTKINRVKFIDDLVRSTYDDGTSLVQVGWERVVVEVEQEVPVYSFYEANDEQYLEQLSIAIDLQKANPRMFDEQVPEELKQAIQYYEETGLVTIAKVEESTIEMVEKVLTNKPTLLVHDPSNVVIDPTCNGDFDKALFVVVSIETNKAELQKKGIYKNLDKVNWESVSNPSDDSYHQTNSPSDFKFSDNVRRKVVAKEYWGYRDIHGDGTLVPIVATWIGDTVIRMELNPFPDEQHPFVLIPYVPIKREMYGETDAELLGDNQKIVGAVMRGMIDSMGRSANGQQGFAKGLLDPLNRRKYDQGRDYEFNPSNGNPSSYIIKHDFPEVPQSAMTMLSLQNQEAEALSGIKSFSGGLSGNAYGDVAIGIKGMLDASAKREMAILRRLADGMTKIGKKIVSMNAIFLSEKEVVRITNEEFVTVNREELKGNFDLIVDIATAEVDESKSQDLAFMLQTLGPNMDSSITMLILSEIAELKRMPELANKLKNFKAPEPSETEIKMGELELAFKEAEIEKMRSDAALNMARAKKESSIADMQDLNYVEQETGTKHERDVAKQKAQSQGNKDLAITKALSSSRDLNKEKPDMDAAIGYSMLSDSKDDVMGQ